MCARSTRRTPRPRLRATTSRTARRRAGLLTVLGAVLAVLTATACAGSHHGTSAPPTIQPAHAPAAPRTTALRTFAPYGPSGAPVAGVTARRSGSCFTTSITVSTRDAYRCFAGNQILDPCFARTRASTTLDCYAAPWTARTVLTLTRPLAATVPSSSPSQVTRPWAIQLADGTRCVAATGTALIVRGVALSFQCDTGTAGLHEGAGSLKKALFSGRDGSLHDVAVAVEWRG